MKKIFTSIAGLIFACTISATQYMHVNLPNGKEYDIKIEKTDNVSHVKKGDELFIKVTKTDSSYSLYPMVDAEVTFDEAIARVDSSISNWGVMSSMIEGCELDTTMIHEMRLAGHNPYELENLLMKKKYEYDRCVLVQKKNNMVAFTDDEIEVMQSANKIATELFGAISNSDTQKDNNTIFSPTSLQFAMAMLANGANEDEAYAEISKLLGKENMPLDRLNDVFSKRMTNFQLVNPSEINIGIANAAFLQDKITFGKNFMQNLNDYYRAATNNVDFKQDSTYKMMDNWADKNTNGMIPSLCIDKNESLKLVLANALSFQSEWYEKFDKSLTEPGKFVTSKGEEKMVDKMKQSFQGQYAEGESYQLITLYFHDGFRMNVVLPKEGVSPESTLEEIDFDNIKYKYGINNETNIDTIYCPQLSLPKFNVDTKIDLGIIMKQLGYEKTFTTEFANIAENIFVDFIKQLAHLEIDEEGAKGAAVTVIGMATSAYFEYKNIDFDVNRPFIVTIDNPNTHEILFIGLINDPTLE